MENQDLKTRFETSFIVFPEHCNYRMPQIFGGAFMAQLDICAASACSQLLQYSDSPCNNAVTYKVLEITFHKEALLGDVISIEAEIIELRNNSITVEVKAHRTPRDIKYPEKILCASGKFVFVTLNDKVFTPHKLSLSPQLTQR